MAGLAGGLENQGGLSRRRHGDVEHLDVAVRQQLVRRRVDARHAVQIGGGLGPLLAPRGNGDRVETRFAVGDQVAVAHDEASADAADAPISAPWHAR